MAICMFIKRNLVFYDKHIEYSRNLAALLANPLLNIAVL